MMAAQSEVKKEEDDLSADIKDWTKHHVRQWALTKVRVDAKFANILFEQDIGGASLLLLDKADLQGLGITFGPVKLLISARDELLKLRQELVTSTRSESRKTCKPYPFYRYHDTCRYIEEYILDVTESGASDYIEPCHEYKAFIHTSAENEMNKFTQEVIRFAAACMNSRTNGTIHFGVGDQPDFTHGQVLGVIARDKEAFQNALKHAIDGHFEYKHIPAAKICIKPVRFVGVLNQDRTSSEKCVIEVDVVPDSVICKENIYHVLPVDNRKAKKSKGKEAEGTELKPSKQFFIRDGSSCRNLLAPTTFAKPKEEYNRFSNSLPEVLQLRKQAEEKHLREVKRSHQGSRLSQMITGGSHSLDKSHFERYLIVTNKSHPIQLESLAFLQELNPTAVLDLDPESKENGLQKHFEEQCTVHSPAQYKITDTVEVIAGKLELTRNTSWVFCNGGANDEKPSEMETWLIDKGASVRDVISFLCRKDILPQKRFLVVFLLLSTVSEKMDPLLETFAMFWQELKGTEQILCICENDKAFTCWKDLIKARYEIDISGRCIYELSFSEVNGTILSLLSENRRASRFLPCNGESRVLLERRVEMSLNTLNVLCVNQCEGGSEDKAVIEENFYKGGKVSWWNFYFSDQPGSSPFIKRDKFDFIINIVIPDLCSLTTACVSFNLMHVPGCGGTTLAMHILWTSKEKFRCAVLEDSNADLAKVADHVVKLLMHDHNEQLPQIPVLLMIDDFEDIEKVYELQQLIEKQCVKKDIQSRSPQVILLNCMRSESTSEPDEKLGGSVFLGNKLSEKEQKQFEQKLVEIEKVYKKNAETFYGFMIMKSNFLPEYVKGVAHNTLKSFSFDQKHAQLIAVLALLNVYCKGASLSVSLCEEYLDILPKPYCGSVRVEDEFGKFSTLITSILVQGMVLFKAVKMIHSSIAYHCLQELTTTHHVKKADIINLLLTTDKFFESTQGKHTLMQDVRNILVKRHYSVSEESLFSPLIQDIANETEGLEEFVLQNASKRYETDSIISQLLARYYYLKKKHFQEAKTWALKAKELSRESSYITDTSAQVIKHELRSAIANKENPIEPEKLQRFLKLAQSAIEVFQEVHSLAKKESVQRFQTRMDKCPLNTAGCLGEIQVAGLVIQILERTPIFSADNLHHDIMSAVLSDRMNLRDLEKSDPKRSKHKMYYSILGQFDDLLYKIRMRMKMNFDFLENFYVNLSSRFGIRDIREQVAQKELFRCFKQYADLFCQSKAQLRNKGMMNTMLQVILARQYLEMRKADTHSGILNYLLLAIPSDVMEKISKQYECVLQNAVDLTLKEKINVIYVNVVLCCKKPGSRLFMPYRKTLEFLCRLLQEKIPLDDNLALYFIAVGLLWPQKHSEITQQPAECKRLGHFVSLLRTAYNAVMKEVCNGKRPFVHFLLGKKQGYERLIPLGEIEKIYSAGQEQISSLWENGKIWKDKIVQELLCRVTGEVRNNVLVPYTIFPDLKIEVIPLFRSQISGRASGSKVSFFVGFSMKGPVAIDID
ncbi:sterile alpha motif domain-containing protein 9-like [Lampris incognitus]|uniref:sterile alpha motif domain-containing protein 9-like n=1 Tax=Lampris incognitus TaxID=2546036 RepID=UPI0024B4A3A8|nr:sterile alpha motif domain-containing protein 9-like [Lampris incognitus]XP_056145516.1 sterile alpha motif domain-containing protein 9-like [Lampris incognitus]